MFNIFGMDIGEEDKIFFSDRQFSSQNIKIFAIAFSDNDVSKYNKSIEKINNYYTLLNIKPEISIIQYTNFSNYVTKIVKVLLQIPINTQIQIILSSNNNTIITALISAGLYLRDIFNRNTRFILIPHYYLKKREPVFEPDINPIPTFLPKQIDRNILQGIEENLNLTQIAENFNVSIGKVSQRLMVLQEYGFLKMSGRERYLTELGKSISVMHKIETRSNKKEIKFNLSLNINFLNSVWRENGFSYSIRSMKIDPKNTYGGLASYWFLTGKFPLNYKKIKIKLYKISNRLNIVLGNRRFLADSTILHRIIAIQQLFGNVDSLPKNLIIDFYKKIFNKDDNSYRMKPFYQENSIRATWEVVTSCKLLKLVPPFDPTEYILKCIVQEGGFRCSTSSKEFREQDVSCTFNGLSLVNQLGIELPKKFISNTIKYLESFWDGSVFMIPGHNEPLLFKNHDIVLSMKILNMDIEKYKDGIFNFLSKLQDSSGGFLSRIDGKRPSASNSYGVLSLINFFDRDIFEGRVVNPLIDLIEKE